MPSQCSPVISNGSEDGSRIQTEQAEGKIVRVLSFDLVEIELLLRKVLQVLRDNDIGSALDCGRQNMPASGIGKADTIDKWLEIHHYSPLTTRMKTIQ